MGDLIWVVSGTGEGPPLARELLRRGWRIHVSVVTAEAARAYEVHPHCSVQTGALSHDGAVDAMLDALQPHWVLDCTHPFATEISARLQRVCSRRAQNLLSLERSLPNDPRADHSRRGHPLSRIASLEELSSVPLSKDRLLLAIGSRHLTAALQVSPAREHFARILDRPVSLQQAIASGLCPERIACVRPGHLPDGGLETALCRLWGITAVLCRQSGGTVERLWRDLARREGLHLVLISPPSAPGDQALPLPALLEKLGHPADPA